MYCDYDLLIQSMNNYISQLEKNKNTSDKKILDALKKTMDTLKSTSELNQSERQVFLNLLWVCMCNSSALINNQR